MVALKRLRSSKAVLKRIRSVTAQRATFSVSAEPINGKFSGACERGTILRQILCSLRARHQFTANNLVPASAEPIYAVMIPMRHVYHITLRCSPATSHSRNAATPATSHRRNAATPATSHRRNAAMPSSGKYKSIHKDELRNCTGSTHMVRSLFILLPPTTSIDWY